MLNNPHNTHLSYSQYRKKKILSENIDLLFTITDKNTNETMQQSMWIDTVQKSNKEKENKSDFFHI